MFDQSNRCCCGGLKIELALGLRKSGDFSFPKIDIQKPAFVVCWNSMVWVLIIADAGGSMMFLYWIGLMDGNTKHMLATE